MNVSDTMKTVGRFTVNGPDAVYMTGQPLTLRKGETITLTHVDPPRVFLAKSTVSFVLREDPDQLDNIPALEFVFPDELATGPKIGETWRRKTRHESDSTFNFACAARDDFENKWFVWHDSVTGDAFVIEKDDFFADRENWERV